MTTYFGPGVFSRPNNDRSYVKILDHLLRYPGSTRKEIHKRVFGKEFENGNRSDIYCALLKNGMMTYDSKYRYDLTEKGRELLLKAAWNSMCPSDPV